MDFHDNVHDEENELRHEFIKGRKSYDDIALVSGDQEQRSRSENAAGSNCGEVRNLCIVLTCTLNANALFTHMTL